MSAPKIPPRGTAPKPDANAEYWKNDALEKAAVVAERYDADPWIASDIRAMKTDTFAKAVAQPPAFAPGLPPKGQKPIGYVTQDAVRQLALGMDGHPVHVDSAHGFSVAVYAEPLLEFSKVPCPECRKPLTMFADGDGSCERCQMHFHRDYLEEKSTPDIALIEWARETLLEAAAKKKKAGDSAAVDEAVRLVVDRFAGALLAKRTF